MREKGAPTPVAWTRLRAPQGLMSPTPEAAILASVQASPLLAKYGTSKDSETAREILTAKLNAVAEVDAAEKAALERAKIDAELAKQQAAIDKAEKKSQAEYDRLLKKTQGTSRTSTRSTSRSSAEKSPIEQILGSKATQTILGGVIRGMFGTGRR